MVDLRSDTISMPTEEMLKTIIGAKLGDDGRSDAEGRGEDITANNLEDLAARLTGKEAAVLFPSGTMGNTAAILTRCKPGDKVMVDEMQHIYLSEKVVFDPSIGQLIPAVYRLNENHVPDLEDMERIMKQEDIALLCVENSHNFSGGICAEPEHMKQMYELAKRHHLPVHMDGARLFHAAAALDVPVSEICRYTDTVMFCISKGLGAPIGSLVCGDRETMKAIREKRKLLGGAMRQAGVIAAPGIYALTHNVEGLKNDNENAAYAAEKLRTLTRTRVQEKVMSNIVMLEVSGTGLSPKEYCDKAAKLGLLIRPVLSDRVRLVFYRDIDRNATEEAVEIIRKLDESLN